MIPPKDVKLTPETEMWLEETGDPEYLPRLRAAMKARRVSAAALSRRLNKSASWAQLVVRGDVPYRGARYVPKGFWLEIRRMGLLPEVSQPEQED